MARQDYRLVPYALAALGGAGLGLEHVARATSIYAVATVLGVLLLSLRVFPCRWRPELVVAVLSVAMVGSLIWGLTAIHRNAAQPEELIRLARDETLISVEGTLVSRPEFVIFRGASQCQVDLRIESVSAGPLVDGENQRAPSGTSAARLSILGDVCSQLSGAKISARGVITVPEFSGRVVGEMWAQSVDTTKEAPPLSRGVAALRRQLLALLDGRPSHVRGLLPGVALGDTSQLDPELEEAMKTTQLTHLVAVSGGHLSLLIGIVLGVVGKRVPLLSAFVSLLAIGGLVVLVGPAASVIRACGMAIVVILAIACGRSSQATAALAVTVMGTAMVDPWLVTHYGFLLSATATAGIVWWGGPLRDRLAATLPSGIAELIAIPLVAQVSCAPVIALFSEVGSIWGVLANAAVAPVVAPLTVSGLVAVIAAPWAPRAASIALIPGQMSTWWIEYVARHLAQWPGSGISLWWATVSTVLVVGALIWIRTWKLALVAMAGAVISVSLMARADDLHVPNDWVGIQCDVGQGSAFIARRDDVTVMVDVGPEGGGAGDCVKEAGVTSIDVLVLSHFHADHVGGLSDVLSAVAVGEVWVSPQLDPVANADWVARELEAEGLRGRTVHTGDAFGNFMTVVWPTEEYNGGANDSSVAVVIDVAGGAIVLGDMEEDSQQRLALTATEVPLLIMAHHGSSSQADALATALSPRVALISVGENSYGHPARSAIELYSDSAIYDTVTCGTIVIRSDLSQVSRCDGPSR